LAAFPFAVQRDAEIGALPPFPQELLDLAVDLAILRLDACVLAAQMTRVIAQGARRAGIIRSVVPRTVPRSWPSLEVILLLCVTSVTGSGKETPVTSHTYQISVLGSLGPATREAFADMVVETEPSITVLSGPLDQHGLHNVLDRVRALGLELIEIRQATPD
jgi:hypothetical protein